MISVTRLAIPRTHRRRRHMRLRRGPRSARRSFVLLAVLIIVGSALLVATSITFMAHAEHAGRTVANRAIQNRALAWSGLQIVMRRLDAQRDRILNAELPELDDQYEICRFGARGRESATGRTAGRIGVVRLLPIGPDGERLVAESAKLDVNELPRDPAEQLIATGWITPEMAEAIIARRNAAPGQRLDALAALLDTGRISASDLLGPFEDLVTKPGEPLEEFTMSAGHQSAEPRCLADLLTVFAAEPALQRDGRLRIDLNVPWSEELGRRLNERFGEGAAAIVKSIIDQGTAFDRDAVIVQVLRSFDVPIEEWPGILDGLTTHGETFQFGRLNINAASERALRALPGITPEQAAEIVRARESLTADLRWTPVWPVLQEIISGEQFEGIVDYVTTRSWTYRMRLAAGEVDAEDPRGPMEAPMVWDVVIDLSDPMTRIAYLRDASLESIAARLALAMGGDTVEAVGVPQPMEVEAPIDADALIVVDAPIEGADTGEEPVEGDVGSSQGTPSRIGRWSGKPGRR